MRRYSKFDRSSCDWHIDGCDLAVVVFLGDSFTGGSLIFGEDKNSQNVITAQQQEKGTAVIFEGCNVSHCVQPIESGTRYSVVIFINKKTPRKCTFES